MEKKAVYVLNLTVSPEQLDNCMEPAKAHIQFRQKDVVLSLLSTSVTAFLTRHGFLTSGQSTSRPGSNRGSPSPRKRRKLLLKSDSRFSEGFNPDDPPSRVEDGKDFVDLHTRENPDDDAQDITWTDPRTGETFLVDPRTGNSHLQAGPPPGDGDLTWDVKEKRRTIRSCADPVAGKENSASQIDTPEWLKKALQANKSYEVGDNQVPKFQALYKSQEDSAVAGPLSGARQISFQEFRSEIAGPKSARRQHRFKKEDLRRSIVINQVDEKFIACLIDDIADQVNNGDETSPSPSIETSGRVLVLIDQHAADERVRAERFLGDLCSGYLQNRDGGHTDQGIRLKELSPSLPLLLTLHEARRLRDSSDIQEAFRHWGFHFDFREIQDVATSPADDETSGLGYTQVFVQNIPDVVSDKGDELRDLVKGFLGQLETEIPPVSATLLIDEESQGKFPWLKALRWCPRELLDLINSKACRGMPSTKNKEPLNWSKLEDVEL
ncbi:hypothetical protein C0991_007841 [Blastosporella zonata]|nr:hypothetical protein C0991_007841 [Blastosporella zonata]